MWGNPDSGIREIFACGIRNEAQGIRIPTKDWNQKSNPRFYLKRLESSVWNQESTAWNPESEDP